MSLISVIMNLSNRAVTQYTNFDFTSFCQVGDSYYAAGADGLFLLGGDTDNTSKIDAEFEYATTDFGSENMKRFRNIRVGGRCSEALKLNLTDDEDNTRSYTVTTLKPDRQTSVQIPVDRAGMARYWTIGFENVNGSDFSIDNVEALLVMLNKRARKIE